MVLDPIPQSLPVHFFGSRPQPPTSQRCKTCQRHDDATSVEDTTMQRLLKTQRCNVWLVKRHLSLTHRLPPIHRDTSRLTCLISHRSCNVASSTSSDVSRDICLSKTQRCERWGAGVEYHFQEISWSRRKWYLTTGRRAH